MLQSVRRSHLAKSFGRKLVRKSSESVIKHALLYPSKTPIFPFQTFISTLKSEDEAALNRLNVTEAAAFFVRSGDAEVEVDQGVLDILRNAKDELVTLLESQ